MDANEKYCRRAVLDDLKNDGGGTKVIRKDKIAKMDVRLGMSGPGGKPVNGREKKVSKFMSKFVREKEVKENPKEMKKKLAPTFDHDFDLGEKIVRKEKPLDEDGRKKLHDEFMNSLQDEQRKIHEENEMKLKQMSSAEIEEMKNDIEKAFSPEVVAILKERAERKLRKVSNVENQGDKETIEDRMKSNLSTEHFGERKERNMLDDGLKKTRYNFDGTPMRDTKEAHNLGKEVQDSEYDPSLYHHDDEPDKAGYNLYELSIMAKSRVTGQRIIAFNTLRNIIRFCKKNDLENYVDNMHVLEFIDNYQLPLLILQGLRSTNASVAIAAWETLHAYLLDENLFNYIHHAQQYVFLGLPLVKQMKPIPLKDCTKPTVQCDIIAALIEMNFLFPLQRQPFGQTDNIDLIFDVLDTFALHSFSGTFHVQSLLKLVPQWEKTSDPIVKLLLSKNPTRTLRLVTLMLRFKLKEIWEWVFHETDILTYCHATLVQISSDISSQNDCKNLDSVAYQSFQVLREYYSDAKAQNMAQGVFRHLVHFMPNPNVYLLLDDYVRTNLDLTLRSFIENDLKRRLSMIKPSESERDLHEYCYILQLTSSFYDKMIQTETHKKNEAESLHHMALFCSPLMDRCKSLGEIQITKAFEMMQSSKELTKIIELDNYIVFPQQISLWKKLDPILFCIIAFIRFTAIVGGIFPNLRREFEKERLLELFRLCTKRIGNEQHPVNQTIFQNVLTFGTFIFYLHRNDANHALHLLRLSGDKNLHSHIRQSLLQDNNLTLFYQSEHQGTEYGWVFGYLEHLFVNQSIKLPNSAMLLRALKFLNRLEQECSEYMNHISWQVRFLNWTKVFFFKGGHYKKDKDIANEMFKFLSFYLQSSRSKSQDDNEHQILALEQLVTLYNGDSFGDPLFSSYLLCFLESDWPVNIRKTYLKTIDRHAFDHIIPMVEDIFFKNHNFDFVDAEFVDILIYDHLNEEICKNQNHFMHKYSKKALKEFTSKSQFYFKQYQSDLDDKFGKEFTEEFLSG